MRAILLFLIVAVVALTFLFLFFFLRNANLGDVWSILKSTNGYWLAAGLLTNFAALLFRTARWRAILDPDHPPPFYPTFFANAIGYMVSTILPVRAADVARPALLARRTDLRFSGALGTVLTERVLDLFSILSLFVYFAVRHWNDFSDNRGFFIVKVGAIVSGALLVILVAFVAGLYVSSGLIRRAHEGLGRLIPKRFRESWMHFFDSFVETLELAKHRTALLKVLVFTTGIWLCLTAQFYFSVLALGRPLPFDSSFLVTGVTTIGLAIPTPGGVGGFHKACQLVLTTFYGMDVDSSVAVAVLFHIVGTLPVIVTGLLLFAHEGMRWRDVTSSS